MANSYNNKNILFIVEGGGAEPTLLKRINRVIGFNEYQVFAYKTAIYELYEVYEELIDDPDLDFLLLLKERTRDPRERHILSQKYASIFLIFDFDPHYQKYSLKKIQELVDFFHDSMTFGLLLLSFPMIEAHRHLMRMPDQMFLELTVTTDEILQYKALVGRSSEYLNLQSYNYQIVSEMIAHHMIKFGFIVEGLRDMPGADAYWTLMRTHYKTLLNLQDQAYVKGYMNVLSMSLFYVIDLKPKTFFNTRLNTMNL